MANIFYQSPNITSHELFYMNFNGQKRPSVMKPVPEYDSIPLLPKKYSENQDKKTTVKNQRLFLFDTQEKTGLAFGKSTSLNMRNFSNVQIGSSDEIREVYQQKAREKVSTPSLRSSMQFPQEVIIELNPLMKTSVFVPSSINLN